MTHSSIAVAITRPSNTSTNIDQPIVSERTVDQVLAALDDTDCRTILDSTREEALTATEVSDAHDLPLSTTYRKLDFLTQAGLLEERTRIRKSGKHASEYSRVVDDLLISLGSNGKTKVWVSQRNTA